MRKTCIGLTVLLLLGVLALPPTALAAPSLAVGPAAGARGTVFAATGGGLTPSRRYAAVTTDATGRLLVSQEFTTNAQGAFALTYNSFDTPPGQYTLTIVQIGGQSTRLASAPFIVTPGDELCFAETGLCVRGQFLDYWRAHGGLALNGYPLTGERIETLEDGQRYRVQYFERTRLERHPEYGYPNDVLLGQFGRLLHPADPPAVRQAGAVYFPETGHNLRAGFREYWQRNGGLAQFGYPITEEIQEQLEDGRVYTVQYFERARFEYHPEHPQPYDVLLGQFGRRILAGRH